MSENVREQIADIVARQTFTTDWMAESDPVGNATDRIIAIVRDALLSEAAVDATAWSLWCDHTIPGKDFEGTHYAVARDALEAALAAAGLAGTGKEQGDGYL